MASKIYFLRVKSSKLEPNIPFWTHEQKLLFEICAVIEYVRSQIKKIRAEKGITQESLGSNFSLGRSGFSKVETGRGKLDVERLAEIAKALDVNITEFFPKPKSSTRFEDSQKKYGYANKADIDDLTFLIKQLRSDIASLKKEMAVLKSRKVIKK